MFEEITIQNYRGLKKVSIRNLSQINLFFGKNNSGKSSILEAIFLITGQSNPVLPITANRIRGIDQITEDIIALDFYGANPENSIRIVAEGDIYRELKIELIQSNSHDISLSELDLGKSDIANRYYGIKMLYKLDQSDVQYRSNLIVSGNNTNKAKIQVDKRYSEKLFSQYIPSNYLQQASVTAEDLSKIIQNKQESDVLDVLRIIEPRLRDIQVIGSDILVDIGLSRRLLINVLGDGIRKILSIIVAIANCANGVLIIDEIDNGLHFSVMTKLWTAIFNSAQKYNVQIFISTHNIDLLKGLIIAQQISTNQDFHRNISSYKLLRKENDEVIALYYNYGNMAYAINQEMEMR